MPMIRSVVVMAVPKLGGSNVTARNRITVPLESRILIVRTNLVNGFVSSSPQETNLKFFKIGADAAANDKPN